MSELLEKLFQELSTICVSGLRIALEDVIHSSERFTDPDAHADFVLKRCRHALARIGVSVETS
jgi:hypothetical protein